MIEKNYSTPKICDFISMYLYLLESGNLGVILRRLNEHIVRDDQGKVLLVDPTYFFNPKQYSPKQYFKKSINTKKELQPLSFYWSKNSAHTFDDFVEFLKHQEFVDRNGLWLKRWINVCALCVFLMKEGYVTINGDSGFKFKTALSKIICNEFNFKYYPNSTKSFQEVTDNHIKEFAKIKYHRF